MVEVSVIIHWTSYEILYWDFLGLRHITRFINIFEAYKECIYPHTFKVIDVICLHNDLMYSMPINF